MRKVRHRLKVLAISTALAASAVAAVAVPVGPASAATTGHHSPASPNTYGLFANSVWDSGVNIRSGPGLFYTANGAANIGETLWDYCYTTGTTIYGNPYWDYVVDAATGIGGYVTEFYLNDGSQTQHC